MSPSLPRQKHTGVRQQKRGEGNDLRVRANMMAQEKLDILRITSTRNTTVLFGDGSILTFHFGF